MLEIFQRIYRQALDLFPAVRFDKHNEVHRAVVSLYCSLIEQSDTVRHAVEGERMAGVDSILRTMLEGMADFVNLINDPRYITHINAAYHREMRKLLENGYDGDNEFLAGLAQHEKFEALVDFHRQRERELTEAGFVVLNHFERFDRANMANHYRSLYNMLCAESHNNLRALARRHIEFGDDGDFQMVMFIERTPHDVEVVLDSIAGMVISSSENIHRYFDSGREDALVEVRQALTDHRRQRDNP